MKKDRWRQSRHRHVDCRWLPAVLDLALRCSLTFCGGFDRWNPCKNDRGAGVGPRFR